MSRCIKSRVIKTRRICRVTRNARGATEPDVSGCLPGGSSIECVGAALLVKALGSGRDCAAFGMCAACGGRTLG